MRDLLLGLCCKCKSVKPHKRLRITSLGNEAQLVCNLVLLALPSPSLLWLVILTAKGPDNVVFAWCFKPWCVIITGKYVPLKWPSPWWHFLKVLCPLSSGLFPMTKSWTRILRASSNLHFLFCYSTEKSLHYGSQIAI